MTSIVERHVPSASSCALSRSRWEVGRVGRLGRVVDLSRVRWSSATVPSLVVDDVVDLGVSHLGVCRSPSHAFGQILLSSLDQKGFHPGYRQRPFFCLLQDWRGCLQVRVTRIRFYSSVGHIPNNWDESRRQQRARKGRRR